MNRLDFKGNICHDVLTMAEIVQRYAFGLVLNHRSFPLANG